MPARSSPASSQTSGSVRLPVVSSGGGGWEGAGTAVLRSGREGVDVAGGTYAGGVADEACPGGGCVPPPGDGVTSRAPVVAEPGTVGTVRVADALAACGVTDGAPVCEGAGVAVALAGSLDGAGADVSVGICGAGVAVSPPDSVAVGFGLGVDVTSRVGEGTVWRKGCMFFAAQACGPMPYRPPAIKSATRSGVARSRAREPGKAFRFFMVSTSGYWTLAFSALATE